MPAKSFAFLARPRAGGGEPTLEHFLEDLAAEVDAQDLASPRWHLVDAQEFVTDVPVLAGPDIAGLCQASQPHLSATRAELEAPHLFVLIRIYLYFFRIYSSSTFRFIRRGPDLFVGATYLFVGAMSGPCPVHPPPPQINL